MKSKIIISIVAIIGFLGLIQFVNGSHKTSCINVYVDFGSLKNNEKSLQCINENGKTNSLALFEKAGLSLKGTDKYGLLVICRVNGLPDASRESCAVMPPEKAYWAVLIKAAANIADPFPKWGWAKTAASDVYLYPGESIGLVFTEGGKVRWPS
jgi:hypothetical protein